MIVIKIIGYVILGLFGLAMAEYMYEEYRWFTEESYLMQHYKLAEERRKQRK